MNVTEENNVMKTQYWAKIGIGIFGCFTRLVSYEMTVAQNSREEPVKRHGPIWSSYVDSWSLDCPVLLRESIFVMESVRSLKTRNNKRYLMLVTSFKF